MRHYYLFPVQRSKPPFRGDIHPGDTLPLTVEKLHKNRVVVGSFGPTLPGQITCRKSQYLPDRSQCFQSENELLR